MILQNINSNTRKYLNKELKKCNIDLIPKMEVVSQDLICEFIDNGSGVGFVLSKLLDKKYKDLKKVNLKTKFSTDVYIEKNKNLKPTFAAQKFLDLL